MSDRLAISTAFSVLMMAVYVLSGVEAQNTLITSASLVMPVNVSAPAMPAISAARDLLGLPAIQ